MFQNDNKAIARKLTKRSLKSDKKRNFFIVMAITLTTLLIGTVFSIGISILESVKTEEIRFAGTMAHAGLGYPTASQISQLENLDYVRTVGTNNHVAYVKNIPQMGTTTLALHYFDKTEWEELRAPACMDIVGSYPIEENEIVVSRGVLEQLGIDDPSVGMEIPLSYYIDSKKPDELIDETFRLSGWFTSYALLKSMNKADTILVSEAFSQKYGKTVEKDGSASLVFDDQSRVLEYCEKLKTDLGLSENQPIATAKSYDKDDNTGSTALLSFGAIVTFIIFTGYLLIYNVLYISVSRDVRFYGLLKTLGTTSKQIKRIVIGQIMRLSLIGIPIGTVLAFLFSVIVVPATITGLGIVTTEAVVSFSPFIYLGAAIFALFTACLGALKPSKKAATISPIDAQRFTNVNYSNKHVYKPARGKPYKMAIRNIFREKKRTVIVLLSLSLGITTFITITTLVSSIGIDNYVKSIYKNDFILKNFTFYSEYQQLQKFDDNFMGKLETLPGMEHLDYTIKESVALDYIPEVFGEYVVDFLEQNNYNVEDFTEEDIRENFHGYIVGVDREFLMRFDEMLDMNIDYSAFERGEIALIVTDDPSLFSGVSELEITPIQSSEAGAIEKINIPLGGFAPYSLYEGGGIAPTVVISKAFMQEIYKEPTVSEIRIDVESEFEGQAHEILKQMISGDNEIRMTSKKEATDELIGISTILFVLGGGIALVIALIGILNFVNVMSVSIMVRKHELATLESIGMSRKQIRRLLISEGLGYALITIFLVLSIGNALTYGIFKLFQQQARYATFTYPYIPMVISMIVIFAISFITPEILYRSINKTTIVERLREAE